MLHSPRRRLPRSPSSAWPTPRALPCSRRAPRPSHAYARPAAMAPVLRDSHRAPLVRLPTWTLVGISSSPAGHSGTIQPSPVTSNAVAPQAVGSATSRSPRTSFIRHARLIRPGIGEAVEGDFRETLADGMDALRCCTREHADAAEAVRSSGVVEPAASRQVAEDHRFAHVVSFSSSGRSRYRRIASRNAAGTERSSNRARSTSRSWSSGSTNAEIEIARLYASRRAYQRFRKLLSTRRLLQSRVDSNDSLQAALRVDRCEGGLNERVDCAAPPSRVIGRKQLSTLSRGWLRGMNLRSVTAFSTSAVSASSPWPIGSGRDSSYGSNLSATPRTRTRQSCETASTAPPPSSNSRV